MSFLVGVFYVRVIFWEGDANFEIVCCVVKGAIKYKYSFCAKYCMVSVFGDWFFDASAIFISLVLCIGFYYFIKTERSKESIIFIFSVIILIISGLPVVTSLFFGDTFIGSNEGFTIFACVFICSLIAVIASAKPLIENL